jgi:hypothetical protein
MEWQRDDVFIGALFANSNCLSVASWISQTIAPSSNMSMMLFPS